MLVFSLKPGQHVDVTFADGSTGRLCIVKSRKAGEIKLAIAAPPEVRFLRSSAVPVNAIPQLSGFKPCPELQEV